MGKPLTGVMKCLRCGYCCTQLSVIIVDDPKKGLREGNLIVHPGNGVPCKHLRGSKPSKFSCAIHNKPWYKKTPCYQHHVMGKTGAPCRMGKYVISKGELPMKADKR
jgi:hypothetical protein